MATLRKRKNKSGKAVYRVDFYHNGRRFVRSTKTDNLKTAKLILKEIESRIAKNIFDVAQIETRKSIYLDEFIPELLEYSRNHKAPKTCLRDRLCLKNFLSFVGNRTLGSVDAKLIDKYLNYRVQNVQKSTANIELRHLKAAFTKAVSWNYIDSNPFKKIKPFRIPQSAPVFFTTDMLELVLEEVPIWLKNIILFDVNTGLRIGEIVNLEWSDIDFRNRIVRVRHKGDFITKSKRERSVPINDYVIALLAGISRESNYVFVTARGKKRQAEILSKCFKKYVRKAQVGEQFTFHSLRHTFASHLVQKGVSLYIVSKLLGHCDLKTTEVYAHLAPETFQDVVDLLDFERQQGDGLSLISRREKMVGGSSNYQ